MLRTLAEGLPAPLKMNGLLNAVPVWNIACLLNVMMAWHFKTKNWVSILKVKHVMGQNGRRRETAHEISRIASGNKFQRQTA